MISSAKLILISSLALILVFGGFITNRVSAIESARSGESESFDSAAAESTVFRWNVDDKRAPLLDLPDVNLKPGLDRSITYPIAQFNF
ncbi:MAG TPA: hypothetical protein VLQ90_08425, partial [Pyrinomonadaceae bacterium]|nr:hypothetical protein [Pyrinomonadaceae bacterium]